jgi:hypothetical protein
MHATVRIYNQPDLAAELAEDDDEIRALMSRVPGLESYCPRRRDRLRLAAV